MSQLGLESRPRHLTHFLSDFFASAPQPDRTRADGCPLGDMCPAQVELGELRKALDATAAKSLSAERLAESVSARDGDGCGGALILAETVAALRAWGLAQAQLESSSSQISELSAALSELQQSPDYMQCVSEDGTRVGRWLAYCQLVDEYEALKEKGVELEPWDVVRRQELFAEKVRFPGARRLRAEGTKEERLRKRVLALQDDQTAAQSAAQWCRQKFLSLRDSAQQMISASLTATEDAYASAFSEVVNEGSEALSDLTALVKSFADRNDLPVSVSQPVDGIGANTQELGFLQRLYSDAVGQRLEGRLRQILEDLASEVPGCHTRPCGLKAPERALQKTMEENGGDF
eukprot:Hpha_TRINITY_DN10334_c0_g1::TRINITY_DN10334_c0_g1_i1::g.116125::m.116125